MRCAQKSKNSTKFTEVYHDMCSAGVTPIRRVFILMLQSFGGGDDQKKEELAEFAVGEMKKYKITSDDYLVYVLRFFFFVCLFVCFLLIFFFFLKVSCW